MMLFYEEHRKECKERFDFLCNAVNDMRFTLTIREMLKDEIEETIQYAKENYHLHYELQEISSKNETNFFETITYKVVEK